MSTVPLSRLGFARIYLWKPTFVNVPMPSRLLCILTGLVLIQLGVSLYIESGGIETIQLTEVIVTTYCITILNQT